jgi:hypothetical protein
MSVRSTQILIPWLAFVATLFPRAGIAGPTERDQRAELREQCATLASGAALLNSSRGPVLVAKVSIPIDPDDRPDRAFANAASIALIEARAEAALFLAGVYSGSSTSGVELSRGSDGHTRAWVESRFDSIARVRLASGEPLDITASEGCVCATVAWGLVNAERGRTSFDEASLGKIAESALESDRVPAVALKWVSDGVAVEGLLVTLVSFPAARPDQCLRRGASSGPAESECSCPACTERMLDVKLQAAIAAWATEGDIGVARTLRRFAVKSVSRVAEGARAMATATSSRSARRTEAIVAVQVPPEAFARLSRVFRHGEQRSVCVALLPIEAGPKPSPGPAGQ